MANKKKRGKNATGAANHEIASQDAMNNVTLALSQTTLSGTPPEPTATPTAAPTGARLTNKNIVQEFDRYFGNVSRLQNWQRLCRDVGLTEEYRSLKQCRLALKSVWVNIHDLLEAVRKNECPPKRFPTQKALASYTINCSRFYPKNKAKNEGPIRDLLAHIF